LIVLPMPSVTVLPSGNLKDNGIALIPMIFDITAPASV
jgi:hypothetical protein